MSGEYESYARGRAPALLTDFYEISMACGYWQARMDDCEAVFHLFFRSNPFKGGFAIACGLEQAVAYLRHFRFGKSDLDYLARFRGNDNRRIFPGAFLDYLGDMRLACDVDAMPEGTVVFPHEPLVRVRGPLIQAQLLETALLNILNFQTLIATKAARMLIASRGKPVIEFGLRRAQGIDGALAAARAAYIGGCSATSNVLAGKLFGMPVRGTQAHSWIMAFDGEAESFRAYAEAMPNNCIFLVDTINSLNGVRKAVAAGKWLRRRGHEMSGIRLDSGDLARLSIAARKILDAGGFPKAIIVASNDLDEHAIARLAKRGARIDAWGVGTKLVTAHGQPALGGVYKLSAIRRRGGEWQYKLKLSEERGKISTPGILQVRRYFRGGQAVCDLIHCQGADLSDRGAMVLPGSRRRPLPAGLESRDLLVPVLRGGRCVYPGAGLDEIRENARRSLACFPAGIRRLARAARFPVGVESALHSLKTGLIRSTRSLS